jgi:hypothetical protein
VLLDVLDEVLCGDGTTSFEVCNKGIGGLFTRLEVVKEQELARDNGQELSCTLEEETTVVGTRRSAPRYLLVAEIKESIDAKSKKLVGSSMIRR